MPCQDDAVKVVWKEAYGRTDPAPYVWWAPPAKQTCGRVVNGARGFPAPHMDAETGKFVNGCAGASADLPVSVNLVWFGSWERTGLAHEFWHVLMARNGQDPDYIHVSPGFQAGGAVAQANAILAKRALCAPDVPPGEVHQ